MKEAKEEELTGPSGWRTMDVEAMGAMNRTSPFSLLIFCATFGRRFVQGKA